MKSKLIVFIGLFLSAKAYTQTDFIPLGNKQHQLLDRLDIKLRNDSVLGFTTIKPYSRKLITERIENLIAFNNDSPRIALLTEWDKLSNVDRYNIQNLLMNNAEWTNNYQDSFLNKKPLLKKFYTTPAHFFTASGNDFFLSVDPLLNLQIGNANDNTGRVFVNTRGVLIKGNIDRRIGFYSYLTENQEKDPAYVREYVTKFQALPGAGYFKNYKNDGYDYFDARGGITFNAGKNFDFAFAYDKLFIGNGYRSLILSDFSNSYLFFKVDTRFWKLKYQNVFAELTAPYNRNGDDYVRPKKYLALHHLSIQMTKWLNIGVFENVMFARNTGFELSYLNPVIFYRSAEQQLGSPDKATLGLDFKANICRSTQLYGQLIINEFLINEVKRYGLGDWKNKHALQLGGKYIDAFGVKNLDLQGEMNIVRPFTYTHRDSVAAYTHYNQPLAHPLGAGFREFIAIAKYQPIPRLFIEGKLLAYRQGLDSAGLNFGSNLFKGYTTRPREKGFFVGTGTPVNAFFGSLNVSYELYNNLFIDGNITHRKYNVSGQPSNSVSFFTVGLRMNMARREFAF